MVRKGIWEHSCKSREDIKTERRCVKDLLVWNKLTGKRDQGEAGWRGDGSENEVNVKVLREERGTRNPPEGISKI